MNEFFLELIKVLITRITRHMSVANGQSKNYETALNHLVHAEMAIEKEIDASKQVVDEAAEEERVA